jgi:hypothetical protein
MPVVSSCRSRPTSPPFSLSSYPSSFQPRNLTRPRFNCSGSSLAWTLLSSSHSLPATPQYLCIPHPDSAIDHRRMSRPVLLSGSHSSVYHPVDLRYSAYSPLPTLRHPSTTPFPLSPYMLSIPGPTAPPFCILPFSAGPRQHTLRSFKP